MRAWLRTLVALVRGLFLALFLALVGCALWFGVGPYWLGVFAAFVVGIACGAVAGLACTDP